MEESIFTRVYYKTVTNLKESITQYLKEPTEKNLEKLKSAQKNLTKTPFLTHLSSFNQMVEEISKSLKKKVNYSFEGDEGFVDDKTFNLLNDSIIHIIRNSIDHGIEEDRKDKKNEASLKVSLKKSEDFFTISIKDDGQGIDGHKISSIAVDKKLKTLKEVSEMTEEEKVNLIFLPGFSSSHTITDLSGRGIGMDVVKTNIQKLGGNVKVKTIKNKGTEFLLNIPKEKVD